MAVSVGRGVGEGTIRAGTRLGIGLSREPQARAVRSKPEKNSAPAVSIVRRWFIALPRNWTMYLSYSTNEALRHSAMPEASPCARERCEPSNQCLARFGIVAELRHACFAMQNLQDLESLL